MLENTTHSEITPFRKIPGKYPSQTTEYSEILDYFGFEYKPVDYYYQVGEIPWVQGWILHISVIAIQLNRLLEIIFPVLQDEKVAFKVVRDRSIANDLLFGYRGYIQLAKLVSIYPENGAKAMILGKRLIALTELYRGPLIPTDIHLGGCVHTRYGSGNPTMALDASGKVNKLILDSKGQWTPDSYNIPFILPEGIRWPFETITSPKAPVPKKILKNKYRTISVLKADARGNVWKAVYLKKGLFTSTCVIKEGKQNMCANEKGLDIRDRLLWQQELQEKLEGIIPLPKIIDCFEEDGNTYLAMEFIKGISVYEFKGLINGNCLGWRDLSNKQQLAIIEILIKIIEILKTLHANGIVHRDITPVNFLIDQEQHIFLIDIELAYAIGSQKPDPPFGFGSPGYMSPEQITESTPTLKEDIYGLSATILNILTGLSPMHFNIQNRDKFLKNLTFFIGDAAIAHLIAAGMDVDPTKRPELSQFHATLVKFHKRVSPLNISNEKIETRLLLESNELRKIIQSGINSLVQSPTLLWDGIWLSKSTQNEGKTENIQREYSIYPGLYDGVGGVLYFLARAKSNGFNIDACLVSYSKGWDFLHSNFLSKLPAIPPGLHSGAAGFAVSLAEGMRSNLICDNIDNRLVIQKCLELQPADLDISVGIAGQGIATLRCSEYLTEDIRHKLLDRCITLLLKHQLKDGSWQIPFASKEKKSRKSVGFSEGVAGVVWFLLEYIINYPTPLAKTAAIKGLCWLDKETEHLRQLFPPTKVKSQESALVTEGGAGILLTFIKAYEALGDTSYKSMVEKALSSDPAFPLSNDLSQKMGLAGLGELYLEAASVFQNDQWKSRSISIANIYVHTAIQLTEDSCYWFRDQSTCASANLMTGNSGLLHFLIRFLMPYNLGHCLIS